MCSISIWLQVTLNFIRDFYQPATKLDRKRWLADQVGRMDSAQDNVFQKEAVLSSFTHNSCPQNWK